MNLRKDCTWAEEESSPTKELNCIQNFGVEEDGSTCKGCEFNKERIVERED
jgi:hypothetical protein